MTPILYYIEFMSYEGSTIEQFFYDEFDARRWAYDRYTVPNFGDDVVLMKIDMNTSPAPQFVETLFAYSHEKYIKKHTPEGWNVAYAGSITPDHRGWKVRLERNNDPTVFVSMIGATKVEAFNRALDTIKMEKL